MFGTGTSGSGWSLTDTVLAIEVVIGVLCAAVGALAVTSAAKDDQKPSRSRAEPTGRLRLAGRPAGDRDQRQRRQHTLAVCQGACPGAAT